MKRLLTWRNLFMLPLVLLIRAPIILVLLAIIRTGEVADELYDCCNAWLPTLKFKK